MSNNDDDELPFEVDEGEIKRLRAEFDRWVQETIQPLVEARLDNLKSHMPKELVRSYLGIKDRVYRSDDLVAAFGENFQILNLFLNGLSSKRKYEFFLDLRGLLVRYLPLAKGLPKFNPRLNMDPLAYEDMPVLDSFEDLMALIDDQLYNLIEAATGKRLVNPNCPKSKKR